MKYLRPVLDVAINPLAMRRPERQAGELLACALLSPEFLRSFRDKRATDPTPDMEIAAREFGLGRAAPMLCGYAVRAIARPDLAMLAMRQPHGRALIAAAIDCLAKETLDDC